MGRTGTDRAQGTTSPAESSFPYAVLRSRWLLVIAVTALVAFGGQASPSMTQYGLVGAMILSTLILGVLRSRGLDLTQVLEVLTVVDVLVVTLVVAWVDPTPPTYLAVFAALILASALGRVGVIMLLMLLVCGVYAGYLYTEIGSAFWRQVSLVLRVPFIFAVGLHFASITSYLKQEKGERDELVAKAKQQGHRADHLEKEQDRLRALSQIGRLALSSPEANPVRVLLEMAHRAQRALGASRCSVMVFPQNAQEQGWNGRSKDRSTEIRTLSIDPDALRAILAGGKLSELRPGDDKDLMKRVKVFFPDSNPFGSLLVAPINTDDGLGGAIFLLDTDHKRKFSEGERDFFWTVALMSGAFIHARAKLEDEIQLRALITNAPVIMFALSSEGTVTLFEGRGATVLKGTPAERLGRSLFDLVSNPDETRESFDQALAGHIVGGTVVMEGTVFETQFSPLRGVDGEISGVMGVTTAILDAPAKATQPAAVPARPTAVTPPTTTTVAPTTAPAPSPGPTTAAPPPPREPVPAPEAPPQAAPNSAAATEDATPPPAANEPRRPASPTARPDLKPLIPLADED